MPSLASRRWDAEYGAGKYLGEPPVGFVARILDELARRPAIRGGAGLYAGCGNGRNYIPLADAGLDIRGVDVSREAIDSAVSRRPDLAGRLECADYVDVSGSFDYVVSIQAFQHGSGSRLESYFAKSLEVLRPGGLLFLRVNSANTDIRRRHRVVGRTAKGGVTARYEEGPKQGLDIHFYSKRELLHMCRGLEPVGPIREDSARRDPPFGGRWCQWELVLEKPGSRANT